VFILEFIPGFLMVVVLPLSCVVAFIGAVFSETVAIWGFGVAVGDMILLMFIFGVILPYIEGDDITEA